MSCHLGAGASLCAITAGRSLDTTMGFTPLEGLVMATPSGSVNPGLLLWLMEQTGMAERELARALEHESGLLGLAGIASMSAALGGLDVLVFTGGVGSIPRRSAPARYAGWISSAWRSTIG